MNEIIFEIYESQEGGYESRALGYSIFTQADTYDEIKLKIKDAVKCHFDNDESPRVIRLHFVRDEVIAL
jgi:hypothetical protein